jgi:hypothetical protein
MNLNVTVATTQKYDIVLKDAAGDIVTSNNPITAVSSDDTVATVTVDPSFTFLHVSATGKVGSAVVTVSDTADNISTTLNVNCAGVPASITLNPVAG